MKAYLKQVRISPKKVNVVAALVRGKNVTEALTQLKFVPKRSAPVLAKLIASAAANAENNFKQDKEKLMISKIIVNEGMTLKRGMPISRGRWHPIKKRTAKILVELSPALEKEAKATKVTKASKDVKTDKPAKDKKDEKVQVGSATPEPAKKKTEVKKEAKKVEKAEEKETEKKASKPKASENSKSKE